MTTSSWKSVPFSVFFSLIHVMQYPLWFIYVADIYWTLFLSWIPVRDSRAAVVNKIHDLSSWNWNTAGCESTADAESNIHLPLSLKAVLLQTVLCIGIYPLTPWQERNSNLFEGKTRLIVFTLTVLRMMGLLALSPTRGRRPRSPRFLSFSKRPFSWSRLLWALNIQ